MIQTIEGNKMRQLLRIACGMLFLYTSLNSICYAQQNYPNHPIKVIVPFPAGGVTDMGARIIMEKMGDYLGQPMLIDNRPGAGTKLGTMVAMKSPKDGYTLYLNNNSYSILPAVDPDPGYNAETDLAPIGLSAFYGMAMIVNSNVSWNNMSEMIEFAKKNPGKLTYGSAGIGSGTHFLGEHLMILTGTKMLHVPYKSTSLASQEVAAGRIDFAFEGAVKPFVDGGRVKIIAVTDTQRDPRYPQVPTVGESGFTEFTFSSWLAVFAPAGTPDPIIQKLNQALNFANNDPSVKKKLADMGLNAFTGTPDMLAKQISKDLLQYKKIATAANIKIN